MFSRKQPVLWAKDDSPQTTIDCKQEALSCLETSVGGLEIGDKNVQILSADDLNMVRSRIVTIWFDYDDNIQYPRTVSQCEYGMFQDHHSTANCS